MPNPPRDRKPAELNLLPVMNLVTILIPLLLISAQFTQLSFVDTTLPGIVDSVTPPNPNATRLSVAIARNGLSIFGENTGVEKIDGEKITIPCAADCAGNYDLEELARVLGQVKDARPAHRGLILVPDDAVPYHAVIGVMDAARDLDGGGFPDASIAGGRG